MPGFAEEMQDRHLNRAGPTQEARTRALQAATDPLQGERVRAFEAAIDPIRDFITELNADSDFEQAFGRMEFDYGNPDGALFHVMQRPSGADVLAVMFESHRADGRTQEADDVDCLSIHVRVPVDPSGEFQLVVGTGGETFGLFGDSTSFNGTLSGVIEDAGVHVAGLVERSLGVEPGVMRRM